MKKDLKYRKGVFIVTFARTSNGVEYLLLKRKLHWTGWEFPKGGIEKGEDTEKAVKRELKEETGLTPIRVRSMYVRGKYDYPKVFKDRPGIKGMQWKLFMAEVKKTDKIKLDSREHVGFKWVDFKTAKELVKFKEKKDSLKAIQSHLRAWDFILIRK
ncbi:RNA pyrophosphohydrolase [uncultured archaeon]|nr:RNA pyrophosphohydrolase [uncultured archaeon]